MRFEVTHVLDAIERHLTTDATLAQAVLDLGEVAWFDALDGGRPVNLLRVGLLVDAFGRHLGEGAIMVYSLAGRDLLADQDLTAKERMVLGRWAGDGLVDVVPSAPERAVEVADLTGLPVLTRNGYPGLDHRYPWLRHQPDRVLRVVPAEGGARIVGAVPGAARPDGPGMHLLTRVWRCPRRDCPSFGQHRLHTRAVPRMRSGVPVCPRHDEPLANLGPRPPAIAVVLLVDGVAQTRFVVRADRPVLVGRSPDDPEGVSIQEWLAGEAAAMISRNHVRLELHDDLLLVSDVSTNGTIVHSRTSPFTPSGQVHLSGGPPYPVKPWDTVELQQGVVLARADRRLAGLTHGPGSVMGDAPTIALRPPPVAP